MSHVTFGLSQSGWKRSPQDHGGECQGAFWSVRWGVWGANLLSSWLSGQAEWMYSLFIWGDRVTQESPYSWARHAQLSCQLAEVTTAEGKDSSAHTHIHSHTWTAHVHRGSSWFQWLFIKCKISLAQIKNQTPPSILNITGWKKTFLKQNHNPFGIPLSG